MLRTRLLLNLAPFVVILLATGVYGVVLSSRMASRVDTTVAEQYRSVVAAQKMAAALAGIDREAWAVSSTSNAADTQALAEHQSLFEQSLASQLKNISLQGELELNQQLEMNYRLLRQGLATLASVTRPEMKHQEIGRAH